jgi:hypothetical protein
MWWEMAEDPLDWANPATIDSAPHLAKMQKEE